MVNKHMFYKSIFSTCMYNYTVLLALAKSYLCITNLLRIWCRSLNFRYLVWINDIHVMIYRYDIQMLKHVFSLGDFFANSFFFKGFVLSLWTINKVNLWIILEIFVFPKWNLMDLFIFLNYLDKVLIIFFSLFW